jgi:hypothetical protein
VSLKDQFWDRFYSSYIYINDLTTFIKDVKIVLYADDISILVTDKSEENLNIKVTKS